MNTRSSLPALQGRAICVYCGCVADSKDHAPPKCLMLAPLPSNLITLPACKACNNGFSFDENVFRAFLSLIGNHPHLVEERKPGAWLERTLQRSPRIQQILEAARQTDGRYSLTASLLESVKRVSLKTVQGMFYGLYDRVVPKQDLALIRVEDQREITVEDVIIAIRPNPLVDITDKPLSEISPESWHARQPIVTMELVNSTTGQKRQRIFRLVRDTPVEWFQFQENTFRAAVVKYDDVCACVLDLWKTLIITVKVPWPDDRGPLRRGRNNPFSRDKK